MTQKEIGLIVGILVVVLGAVAGAAVFLTNKESGAKASTGTAVSSSSEQQETTIPLTEAPSAAPSGGDSLTVVAGTNTANPAQLGSGQVASKPNGGTVAPASVPGPETFGQYEQYKDGQAALIGEIEAGNGNEAVSGKKVAVYYKGWLTNGTMFDQLRPGDDGQLEPFVFTLGAGQVIRGWEQGIIGMKVGGTRRLIIPPVVGYGAQAQGNIPANSVLIFDVQLLAIQ